jgi:proline iminopeptidase
MRLILSCILFLLINASAFAQQDNLYSAAYGNPASPAIIFIHGGPGYNAFTFEASTARALAAKGYYVIVYDQRGCGRSKQVTGSYNRSEAVQDLFNIYQKYNLKSAALLGHSWGGTVAAWFALDKPGMVQKIILCGAPLDYQLTLRTIIAHARARYEKKNDKNNLAYIATLEKADPLSLMYSSYAFAHAMQSGLYVPEKYTDAAKSLYKTMSVHPDISLSTKSEFGPVQGFFQNEKYTTLHITDLYHQILENKIPVAGIYGAEDGLFNEEQIELIRSSISPQLFTMVKGASHSVFIDQQDEFIRFVHRIMK